VSPDAVAAKAIASALQSPVSDESTADLCRLRALYPIAWREAGDGPRKAAVDALAAAPTVDLFAELERLTAKHQRIAARVLRLGEELATARTTEDSAVFGAAVGAALRHERVLRTEVEA